MAVISVIVSVLFFIAQTAKRPEIVLIEEEEEKEEIVIRKCENSN